MMAKGRIGIAFILYVCLSTGVWATEEMKSVTDPMVVFQKGYLQVVGASEEGLPRYKAMREAQAFAYSDLVANLQGLYLFSDTSLKDAMKQSDEIKKGVEGFFAEAVKCGQIYHQDTAYAEVCMRISISGKGGLYGIIIPLIQEDKLLFEKEPGFNPSHESISLETETVSIEGSAKQGPTDSSALVEEESKNEDISSSALTNPYDGLIVDVRDYPFHPALINRVITEKDEVLFEPFHISYDLPAERGCCGFASNNDKARSLLENWGSTNPVVVVCTDVKKFTDAMISLDDAGVVSAHDQKTDIFSQARVVFIVKK